MSTLYEKKLLGAKRRCSIPNTPQKILNVKGLIIELATANTVDVLYALGESPKSWSDLLAHFGMTRRQTGHLGHFMRIAQDAMFVKKDHRLGVFYLTHKGRKSLEFLNAIQAFANQSIAAPYQDIPLDTIQLDMQRPWLESLLEKEIRKAIKTTTQGKCLP